MRAFSYLAALLFFAASVMLAACGGGQQAAIVKSPTHTIAKATAATRRTKSASVPEAIATPRTTPAVPITAPATLPTAQPRTTPATRPVKSTKVVPSGKSRKAHRHTARPRVEPTKVSTPVVTPQPAKPVRFVVNESDVKINAPVEYVGQTADGAMDVPKKWQDVAWYKLGYLPGQKGNSVIAGHYDSTTGPAVFWKLSKLKLGDMVAVVGKDGRKLNFRVIKKAVYYNDKAPLYKIFGPAPTSNLNLITCDGIWNPDKKEYDRKLVIFTTLVRNSRQ